MDKASSLAYTHWGLASSSRTFSSSALLKGGTPAIFHFTAAWDFALTSANSFRSPSMAIHWSSTGFFNSCSSGAGAGGVTPKGRLTSERRKMTNPVCRRDRKVVQEPRRKRWWRAGWWP